MKIDFVKLALSIILCLSVGFAGSIFTAPSIPIWYATLNKPIFNPPSWIFAPVWTILYVLMGVSLYLIWTSRNNKNKKSINLFWIQLALNLSWSYVFFELHNIALAFVNILTLDLFIFLTIKSFLPVSKMSSYLLYPYLCWVSFATILNFYILRLN